MGPRTLSKAVRSQSFGEALTEMLRTYVFPLHLVPLELVRPKGRSISRMIAEEGGVANARQEKGGNDEEMSQIGDRSPIGSQRPMLLAHAPL